ncbi:hypothetical protein FACS189449_07580 [Alphaproteobacteria bacterium]|nr:hypothetical protein FACS189449_07580 [Alphaproteobacteria bacterium]
MLNILENEYKRKILYFFGGVLATIFAVVLPFVYLTHKESSYESYDGIIVEHCDDSDVAELLVKNGIADSEFTARIAVQWMKSRGFTAKIGEYKLPLHVSIMDAIRIFTSDEVVVHKFVIPEGLPMITVIKRLNESKFLLGQIEDIPDEGELLPSTYSFTYPTTRQHIIATAQEHMKKFIEKEWPRRSKSCILKTPYEAIILASIVEKETNVEREKIAGVFIARLQQGMRLQSCPTVIYAITCGEPLGRNLKYSDLHIKSQYNTYRNAGLPPAPITNPGKECIMAVLHPEVHDYLFFVLKDKKRHAFSKTFEEHKKNKAEINAAAKKR